MSEIQPCPICGGEAQTLETGEGLWAACTGPDCPLIGLPVQDWNALSEAMQLREAVEASVPWLDRSQLNTIHISRGEGIWFVRASGRVNKHLLKVADECGGPLSSVFKLVAAALIALAGEGNE